MSLILNSGLVINSGLCLNRGLVTASGLNLPEKTRYAYNMDGIDDRWTLANRAINPDGDIDIEFYAPDVFGATKVILSQNITSTNTTKEFQLETSATGSLIIRLGGAAQNMGTVLPATKYRISLVGTSLVLYSKEGAVVSSLTFNRGATREPTAVTVVGAATNGVANSYAFYFTGIQRDIKINGVLWKMDQRNQTVQPSVPAGNNMTGTNLNPDRWVEIAK